MSMAISSWKHPHNLVCLVRELSEQYAIVAAADEELERAARDGRMDPCELGKMKHQYRITAANFFNCFTASKKEIHCDLITQEMLSEWAPQPKQYPHFPT